MITVSERAGEFLKMVIAEDKLPDGTALRIGVTQEGCQDSGTTFRYQIEFEDKPVSPNDEVFQNQGVHIRVNRESLQHLDGLELDLILHQATPQFQFRNSNARHSCGCGNTFSD